MSEINIEIVYNNNTTEVTIPAAAYDITVQNGQGPIGPAGPAGPSGGSGTQMSNGTDANVNMVANGVIFLPPATLTQNRNIVIPSGTDGNFMEIYNEEAGFQWIPTGQPMYYSDGVSTVSALVANTNYLIKFKAGKWRILN
jgi:hypothetical protein